MFEIFHLFNIKSVDSEKIFDALTTEKGLAGWWTTGVIAKPEVNSIAEFKFMPDYHNKMLVKKLTKYKHVEWKCILGDKEWIDTTLSFDIIPKKESIDIKFSHSNWRAKTDLYGICNYHWGLYMKSLKSFIEDGKGNPHIFN